MGVEIEQTDKESKDPGAHYRHTIIIKLKPEDIERGFVTVKVDPYFIALIYKMVDHMEFFILKRVLRMGSAHKNKRQECLDIINAAERRIEVIDEDLAGEVKA